MELVVDAGDVRLAATLSLPVGVVRRGVVVLHGAGDPERGRPVYAHLARVLPPLGVAVLRYDRRLWPDGDVPLAVQARDAAAAVRELRARIGDGPVISVWGYSQGAWAAAMVAADNPEIGSLVAVSAVGISPAAQMRFGVAEQLRRNGFADDIGEMLEVRAAYEDYLRGDRERGAVQALVDRVAGAGWFEHAYVRRTVPERGVWVDMDFDPATVFSRVRCPVLAVYGDDDEWVPVDESVAVWRRVCDRVTIVRLPGCGHEPRGTAYRDALVRWFS